MQTLIHTRCSNLTKCCSGTCTGYDTSSSCPPLIVLAVLASAAAILHVPVLAGAAR